MFEHLKRLDVADKTSWVDLPEVSPGARLLVRPAGQANPAYLDALLRRSVKRAKAIARADALTVADVRQSRDDDRELYARHVLVGWEEVRDADGNLVPFSREVALELLRALPDYIFDRIREHVTSPERFLREDEEGLDDPEALAGNSGRGSSGS